MGYVDGTKAASLAYRGRGEKAHQTRRTEEATYGTKRKGLGPVQPTLAMAAPPQARKVAGWRWSEAAWDETADQWIWTKEKY